MKISALAVLSLISCVSSAETALRVTKGKKPEKSCKGKKKSYTKKNGPMWRDNSERLLLREGVIDSLPKSLCDDVNSDSPKGKNVILVIGDGMGWEMVRAGAVAKQVLEELEQLGVDTTNGSTGSIAEAAKAAFAGRTLSDYYTEGKGSGLSFQDALDGFHLVTTSAPLVHSPTDGAHYAPASSMLEGDVSGHDDGMAPLAVDECTGDYIDFSPYDFELDGGNMVLWDDERGGKYPWDPDYWVTDGNYSNKKFDPEFIMRHATDSANTAGSLATGVKAGVNMLSVDLYEEKASTLVEDALMCGKSGGVISSVPVLHATPAAFVSHSNYRKNGPQMQRTLKTTNPTLVMGGCASRYQPSEEHKDLMRDGGTLESQWTILEQSSDVLATNFYDSIQDLDPDDDQHVLACFGGDYTASGEENLPYRGLNSDYSARYCSSGDVETDENGVATGVTATTSEELCDHYSAEERAQIPIMAENVKQAINFLGKDDQGFFMMYEQGDIDWAAHANHMDDMLGAMLDISDGTQEILDWIADNGGWEKNALYVTADHDHYLTLKDEFPEAVANFIIDGMSHKITPQNNSNVNPWDVGTSAGRHEDDSKSTTEHISDFASWTDQDIEDVAHFWGSFGSGGNGWGSHSTRPVPVFHAGDDGCIEQLLGAGYKVIGRDVEGSEGKIDQVHLHACMLKNLFGL